MISAEITNPDRDPESGGQQPFCHKNTPNLSHFAFYVSLETINFDLSQ
jgi:hypothetical protein